MQGNYINLIVVQIVEIFSLSTILLCIPKDRSMIAKDTSSCTFFRFALGSINVSFAGRDFNIESKITTTISLNQLMTK